MTTSAASQPGALGIPLAARRRHVTALELIPIIRLVALARLYTLRGFALLRSCVLMISMRTLTLIPRILSHIVLLGRPARS